MSTLQRQATILGLMAVLCWSTVATAFKLSLQYLSPLQLILIASLSSWLFLVGILLIQGRLRELSQQSLAGYFHSFCFGLLNPLLYYWLLFSAYAMLPAQEAQALNYTWAIVMSLLAVPLLGQKLTKGDVAAALACYAGVLVIGTQGNIIGLEFANIEGVLFALASTVVWSLYWIFGRRDVREPILGLCLNFSFVLPMLLAVCWWSDQLNLKNIPWQGFAGGVYVGLFEMGLGFVLWLFAMKRAERTAPIANLIFVSPFLSLFFISIFLKEEISYSTLIGLLLIVSGLVAQAQFNKSTVVSH